MKKKPQHPAGKPLRELDVLQNRLRALFSVSGDEHGWNPTFELTDDDPALTLTVNPDGVGRERVNVSIDDEYLTVTCRRENDAAPYLRRIQIPEEVEVELIKAVFRDGILIVRLPKGAKNPSPNNGKRDVPLE